MSVDPRCIYVREAISAVFDGESSTAEALVADAHLQGCQSCQEFAAQIHTLTNELQTTVPLNFMVHATESISRADARAARTQAARLPLA